MNAEIEQIIDEALPPACCACGRSLPRPGVRCECGTYPDPTREEFARQLLMPGELSRIRADGAVLAAESLMHQFVTATGVPDRLRMLAELEEGAAAIQEGLQEAMARRQIAQEAVTAAEEDEAEARVPLTDVLELSLQAADRLTEVQRTCEGDEAEWKARIAVAELRPIIARRQQVVSEYAAVTAQKRRELEEADLEVAECDAARDEDVAARLFLDEVRPTLDRLLLLARPVREYLAELLDDRDSGRPELDAEWSAMLGVIYEMAGAVGLLDMAEEGAMPRVLGDLAGPMSRAADVAALAARLPQNRLALPPAPGEASMTLLANTIG